MKEQYVSFEVAKLLKERGFDEKTVYHYTNCDVLQHNIVYNEYKNSEMLNAYSAPTQQMACKWLIETHNIHIEPHFLRASGDYVYDIIHSPLELDDIHSFPTVFNTKEDAVEAALQYCLTNLI